MVISRGFRGRRRRGLSLRDEDEPGCWESNGYHVLGDPWLEQRYLGD
jgi:DMSO/TMAO reductase YedYZ molybdopterin-dependent catalytic subunit